MQEELLEAGITYKESFLEDHQPLSFQKGMMREKILF